MNRSSLLAALALGAMVLAAGGPATRAGEQILRDAQNERPAPSGASVYSLDSKWTTQEGAEVELSSFAGKPVVVAMGYTTCRDICPAIVVDMMWIEKHLSPSEADRVRFAFFSFDPEADTPERLRLYAEGHGLDLNRWTLLTANDDTARDLTSALGIGYRQNGRGGFDHVPVISLLNERGEIVLQQRGAQGSSDELLGELRRLLPAHN